MKIPEQTCWGCKNFDVSFEGDWSDMTPGAGFTMVCAKGHFHLGERMDEKEFAEAMEQGFTCPDFERKETR